MFSFTVQGDSSIVLDPISKDEAIRTGQGRNINETIQVVDCNGEECLYSLGYVLKKVSDLAVSTYAQKAAGLQDLEKKGREIEKKLIRSDRFQELNY